MIDADASAQDRLRWLSRNAWHWMLAIVLLVVAGLVGVSWTLGLFTSSSPNPENTVSSGSMSQDNSADNTAIMSSIGMVPGDMVSGTATIENVGDARGDFVLLVKNVTDDPGPGGGVLSAQLELVVYEGDGTQPIWSGPLPDLDVDLGTWQASEEHTYRFEVTLPDEGASIDNPFQGSRTTATFEWNAVQSN